jgi:hypothetical protein
MRNTNAVSSSHSLFAVPTPNLGSGPSRLYFHILLTDDLSGCSLDQKPKWTCRKSLHSVCEASIESLLSGSLAPKSLLLGSFKFNVLSIPTGPRSSLEKNSNITCGIRKVHTGLAGRITIRHLPCAFSNMVPSNARRTQRQQFCSSLNDALPDHAIVPVLRQNVCSQAFLSKARSGETLRFEDFGFFAVGQRYSIIVIIEISLSLFTYEIEPVNCNK